MVLSHLVNSTLFDRGFVSIERREIREERVVLVEINKMAHKVPYQKVHISSSTDY